MNEEILALEEEIRTAKMKLSQLRKKQEPKAIEDYTFKSKEGKDIKLSSLFGDSNELMIIHNMGKGCAYCTLWADEYNGVYHHLSNRVPFVVESADDSATMAEFAESRNWNFPIVSSKENSFKKDLDFEYDNGGPRPGVSVLIKDESGQLFVKTSTRFGPGDNYCSVWDYFDLLPGGSGDWRPKFSYN